MARRVPTEIEVSVASLTPDGLGIAHDQQRTLHVRNALPGEAVNARILRKRKGVRFADAIHVNASHKDRVSSICQYFPRCGGCNMHHYRYSKQLDHKQTYLAECLRANGVGAKDWAQPKSHGMLGYRTKARLGVRKLGDQVLVGFRESFSNRVSKMEVCLTLTPQLSALITPLKQLIAQLSIADQIPQVELAQGEDGISLMLRHLAELSTQDLALLEQFARTHDIQMLLQSKGYDSLVSVDGQPIELRHYTLPDLGLMLNFHPAQFTQVNQPMNRRLINRVLSCFAPLAGRKVVDLFCGIGNFTLPLVRAGAQAWGLEAGDSAVSMAQSNAQLNRLSHRVACAAMDLYTQEAQLPERFDGLVLDPPRSGAGPQLPNWLDQAKPAGCRDIVYVSCNPQTFASDAATIVAAGFSLKQVGIHDMFPHTGHVETLGWFQLG